MTETNEQTQTVQVSWKEKKHKMFGRVKNGIHNLSSILVWESIKKKLFT